MTTQIYLSIDQDLARFDRVISDNAGNVRMIVPGSDPEIDGNEVAESWNRDRDRLACQIANAYNSMFAPDGGWDFYRIGPDGEITA